VGIQVPKLDVAGSSPVARSLEAPPRFDFGRGGVFRSVPLGVLSVSVLHDVRTWRVAFCSGREAVAKHRPSAL
jgi:hypothetical protein